jgi:hypothetical protein
MNVEIGTEAAIPLLGIFVSNFRYCVFAVCTNILVWLLAFKYCRTNLREHWEDPIYLIIKYSTLRGRTFLLILPILFKMEKGKSPGLDGEKKEVGLERSRSSSDLRGSPISLRQPEGVPCQDQSQLVIPYKQPGLLRTSRAEGSSALMRAKSRSSWELSRSWEDGEKSNSCTSSSSWEANSREDSRSCQKSRSREGNSSSKSSSGQKSSSCEGNSSSKSSSSQMSNRWEGNSSGESSKSSSPEPESEFLRVFAQLRAARPLAV